MSLFIIIFVILFGLSNGTVIKYNAGHIVQKQPNQNLAPMLRALTELKLNLINENSQAVAQGQGANPEDPKQVINANFPQKKMDVMASFINGQNRTKEIPNVSTQTKYIIINPTKIVEKSPKRRKSNKNSSRKKSAHKDIHPDSATDHKIAVSHPSNSSSTISMIHESSSETTSFVTAFPSTQSIYKSNAAASATAQYNYFNNLLPTTTSTINVSKLSSTTFKETDHTSISTKEELLTKEHNTSVEDVTSSDFVDLPPNRTFSYTEDAMPTLSSNNAKPPTTKYDFATTSNSATNFVISSEHPPTETVSEIILPRMFIRAGKSIKSITEPTINYNYNQATTDYDDNSNDYTSSKDNNGLHNNSSTYSSVANAGTESSSHFYSDNYTTKFIIEILSETKFPTLPTESTQNFDVNDESDTSSNSVQSTSYLYQTDTLSPVTSNYYASTRSYDSLPKLESSNKYSSEIVTTGVATTTTTPLFYSNNHPVINFPDIYSIKSIQNSDEHITSVENLYYYANSESNKSTDNYPHHTTLLPTTTTNIVPTTDNSYNAADVITEIENILSDKKENYDYNRQNLTVDNFIKKLTFTINIDPIYQSSIESYFNSIIAATPTTLTTLSNSLSGDYASISDYDNNLENTSYPYEIDLANVKTEPINVYHDVLPLPNILENDTYHTTTSNLIHVEDLSIYKDFVKPVSYAYELDDNHMSYTTDNYISTASPKITLPKSIVSTYDNPKYINSKNEKFSTINEESIQTTPNYPSETLPTHSSDAYNLHMVEVKIAQDRQEAEFHKILLDSFENALYKPTSPQNSFRTVLEESATPEYLSSTSGSSTFTTEIPFTTDLNETVTSSLFSNIENDLVEIPEDILFSTPNKIGHYHILQEAESIQIPDVVPPPEQYHLNFPVYTSGQNHQTGNGKMFEQNRKLIRIPMGTNNHLKDHRRSDIVIGNEEDSQHVDRPEKNDSLQRKTDLDVGPLMSVWTTVATPRHLDHGYVPTFTEQQLLEFVPHIIEGLRNKLVDPNNEEMAHIFGDLWELMVEESKRNVNFENMSPILESILNSNKPKHPRTRYTREASNQKYFNINPFDKKFEILKKKTTKPTKKPLNDKSVEKKQVTLGSEDLLEIEEDEEDDYYDNDYTNADAISRSSAFDDNASIYELINLAASRKLTKMHQDQLRRALDTAEDDYVEDDENVDYIYK